MRRVGLSVIIGFVLWLGGANRSADAIPPAADPAQTNMAWVDDFFRDYAEAFRARSTDRLLAKFALPLTFLTKGGPIAFNDRDRLAANVDALIHRYERIGAADYAYTIKDVRTMGDGIELIKLEWRFLDARDELIYACDTTYILAHDAKAPAKVMAVVAHNENEEYEKALKRKTGG